MWLLCSLSLATSAEESPLETRVFTDSQGRILRGQITGIKPDTVTVRRVDDGRPFDLPISTLSTLDQAFLNKERSRIEELLTPLPDTDFTRSLLADFAFLNERASGLKVPPEDAWARARRFVILYGFQNDPPHMRQLSERIRKIQKTDTTVLWLGPDRLPLPEADLAMARVLPPGVAVIRRKALDDGLKASRTELERIAWEETLGEPRLFRARTHRSTAEERRNWHSRIRAAVPPYWPTGGFLRELATKDPTYLQAAIYVLDRDGAHLTADADIRTAFLGYRFGEAPLRVAPSRPQPAPAATTPLSGDLEPKIHTFTNTKGQSLRAWIMAISTDMVRVRVINENAGAPLPKKPTDPGYWAQIHAADEARRNLLSWTELSEPDRLLMAELRLDPRYQPPSPPAPLPPRPDAEAERQRAARFAVAVFLGEQSTGRSQLIRWSHRPKLDLRAESPEFEALLRSHYDDLCAAAGFTGMVDPDCVIHIAVGSSPFLRQLEDENEKKRPRGLGIWHYAGEYNSDHTLRALRIAVNIDSFTDLQVRRVLVQAMSMCFGGRSSHTTQWKDSVFFNKSTETSLTDADRRLFRILYRHAPANVLRDDVLEIVSRHWANPDADRDAALDAAPDTKSDAPAK